MKKWKRKYKKLWRSYVFIYSMGELALDDAERRLKMLNRIDEEVFQQVEPCCFCNLIGKHKNDCVLVRELDFVKYLTDET